jgi:hypothetical protein
VRILLVGSLSWNPERIVGLREQGHELWGLWARSMAWDQGPYPMLAGSVTPIELHEAAATIRTEGIDCVYSLFQTYAARQWAPACPGVDHDHSVWALLRELLRERRRGRFDVPFVHHFGFDVHELDLDVVRALDGHIFCNREKLAYWTTPKDDGGCGFDLGDTTHAAFLDGDRPRAEFMGDGFAERLSDCTGEIHTVCVGRPFNIDYLAAARRGIHVHLYGKHFDGLYRTLARDLSEADARRHREQLCRFLHVHPSLQTIGQSMADVRCSKSRWVTEFSRYDAGWSYLGTPMPWPVLDDRGAIPNRLSTYILAGLPVITDRRPSYYRYEELWRLGVAIDLVDADYDGLKTRLQAEIETREHCARAREAREAYSFDASIPALVEALTRACERYRARPLAERTRFAETEDALVRDPGLGPRAPANWFLRRARRLARLLSRLRGRRKRSARRRARRLRMILGPWLNQGPDQVGASSPSVIAAVGATRRRVVAIERFDEPSRRCTPAAIGDGVELSAVELDASGESAGTRVRELLVAAGWWLLGPLPFRRRRDLFRACLAVRDLRLASLMKIPAASNRVRAGAMDEVACFSSKGLEVVPLLASALDVPFTEVLATTTQYFGEFAFELQAVVPYAYWLHQQGRLRCTIATPDTRCLYYFSENHEERQVPRRYVPLTEYPAGEEGEGRFDKRGFAAFLDERKWSPPPYKEQFRDERFRWDRTTCVICNKMSDETYLKQGGAGNSMDSELVLTLVGRLRERYQVVYNRPRAADIVNDHQEVIEPGDIEEVCRTYPDVLTIQALHAQYPELSYNELQLRLFAGCERFVSVLGGSSYLASWFGGINVVLARCGWEVDCGAFERWFDRFSGARVVAVDSSEALLAAVEEAFLGPDAG